MMREGIACVNSWHRAEMYVMSRTGQPGADPHDVESLITLDASGIRA